MRLLLLISLFFLGLCMGCQPAQNEAITLVVKNDSDQVCANSPVTLALTRFPSADLWAPYSAQGEIIPFQYDDTDGDGKADEIFFLVEVAANGSREILFRKVESIPDFETRTHIRLGKKTDTGIEPVKQAQRLDTWDNKVTQAQYQFEGPGWENEQVAFRNYIDQRNGMDIFGKTKAQLCLDQVGADGAHNYHELDEWGMDVLKVGSSLGAGSVALLYKDSLIRLTGANANFAVISEGPLRSALVFSFRGVDLGDKTVDVTHGIGITAGMYAYEAFVKVSDPEGIKIVPGIVDLHDLSAHTLENEGATALFTYGLQSENKDSLGMAIIAGNELEPEKVDTDDLRGEIPNSYGLILNPAPAAYRFYACWELSNPEFGSEDRFKAFLEKEAAQFSHPLTLEWKE